MKNKFLYILVLIGGMFFFSCEDFLDTESISNDNLEYLCSNPTDARKMVNHIYAFFCEDSFTSRMSNNWNQNTDVEFAPVSKAQAMAHNDRRGVWAINAGDFADILTCWDDNYKAIDFANQVIEGIEASESYQSGNKDMQQLLGEAYCLRAYRYFLLCNFWADVPLALTPTKYGDKSLPRTDKNIIYSKIIQDLINVEETMKWADNLVNGTEYMNREFALGFIAKLAMFRAGYSMQEDGTMKRCQIDAEIEPVVYKDENGAEKIAQSSDDFYKVAQAYARKLIKLKDRKLPTDYKNIFYTQINSASSPNDDVLYEIGFVQNGGGDVGWNIGLSVVSDPVKGSGTTYTFMSPAYACSFAKEDQRLPVTCASYRYLTGSTQNAVNAFGICPAKWCRLDMESPTASKNTGINWPILRYPDVLLILAEANNELNNGPDAEAKQMLKRVRERAFANASNKSEMVDDYMNKLTDYQSFKKAIIDERAWEFGGECIRKFDLIRWNYYSDAIVNTIDWMLESAINVHQLRRENEELIYDKNKEIEDLGVAGILYFTINNGIVEFENDIFTHRDAKEDIYKNASTVKDEDIKAGYTSSGLQRIDFAKAFISVAEQDPTTKEPYGTDENGDKIKKGTVHDNILASWFGLTDGTLIKGTENLSSLRSKVTPYVLPIPGSRKGAVNNDGYAIRNK